MLGIGTWLYFPKTVVPDNRLPPAAEDWFSDGVLPAEWTFARSAAALSRGADGRWTSYAANTIRPYHHPVSLARLGFLLETQARTQLIYRSRSTAGVVSVVANSATISTDAAVQTPFGVGCTKIVPTATVAQHGFNLTFGGTQAAAVSDNTTVAFQVYLKSTGTFYTRGEFFLLNRAGVYSSVAFTLEGAGTVTATTGSVTAAIVPDTDGFYCLTMVMQYGAGTTNPTCNMLLLPAAGTRSHAGDGTNGVWMAYLGAEVGTEPTSPILSDGTVTVTRPAESLTSVTNWFQPGPKSFGIQYTPLSISASQTILYATASDLLEIRNGGETVTFTALVGNVSSAAISGSAPAPGIERTVVVVAARDEFRLVQDGTIIGTDATGETPSDLPVLRIGSSFGGLGGGAMLLKRIKYWSRPLSASEAPPYSEDLSKVGQVTVLPVLDIQPTRTVLPSETTITLTVTLTGEASGASVNWSTLDDTALSGVDYIGDRGVLGFSPGVNSAEIIIDLATRSTEEERTFAVELVGPVGATLGNARCVVTLQRIVQQGPVATVQNVFGATLPAEWVLTRSTSGRARNASGIWANNSANVPRQHYIAAGVSGLLLEPGVTTQNIFDSVDPGWVTTASTKAIDTTTQTPTGTKSLVWLKDATTATHKLTLPLTQSANVDMPTGEFTLSMMVKPSNWQIWRLKIKGIDNVIKEVRFDLTGDGSVVTADTGIITMVEREPILTDWYRISMDRSQATSAGVSAEIELAPVDSSGNESTVGDTSQGITICHVQLEPGAGYSSPVVVTSATAKVTRAPDVLKATGTWFQKTAYAMGIRFIRMRDAPSTQILWQVRDTAAATTNDLQALQVEAGNLILRTRTGGTTLTPTTGGATTRGGQTTALMVVDSASRIALFDQGAKRGEIAVGTGGVAAPVAPTVIRIGASEPNGTNPGTILLLAAYLWDAALSDTDAALFSGNLAYSPPADPAKPPVLSIPAALSVREGSTLSVPITKSGAGACSVTFRTKAGTATLNTDYVGVLQTVSFNSNDTTMVVDIVTVSDAVAEDPPENFQIILETPTGATLGNAVCVATITELPRITMPSSFSVNEGSVANITLSKVGTGACSVVVQTGQVTATVGTDYTGVGPLTISFTADQTSAVVSVPTSADAAAESTETFNLNMTSPTGCTIGTPQCVVSIIDATAEPPPSDDLFAAPRGFATSAAFGVARSGGDYYRVTNLNDSGTGSLFGAFGLSNRLVIFEVAGVIKWTSDKRITGSNLTFAGETAPEPGITIQGTQAPLGGRMMSTLKSNGINWRHVVWERGYADPEGRADDPNTPGNQSTYNTNADNFSVAPNTASTQSDWWFDHCAFFWSNDENVQLYHGGPGPNGETRTHENTGLFRWDFTNCMFCEPLYSPESLGYLGHWENRSTGSIPEYKHNYNFLVGPYCKQISIQYCMFAEHGMRGPFIDYAASIVLANNLAINCAHGATVEMNDDPATPAHKITCVGYLMISGPNAPIPHAGFRFTTYPNPLPGSGNRYYIHDLYAMKGARAADGLAPTAVTWDLGTKHFGKQVAQPGVLLARTATKPIDIPGGATAMSAQDIYDRAKANVGPRPKERNGARAHPAVARAIQKLRDKTGKWVNHESVAGGGTGKTSFTQVNRKLDGTTKFPDGTTIPAPPTYSNAAAVNAWLKSFRDRLQYD